MIKRLYFYNVWANGRPAWVNNFLGTFTSLNDDKIELLDISMDTTLNGIRSVLPSRLPCIPISNSYRRVMFGHSLAKFWTILDMEQRQEHDVLVFDSDVILLRPLSEMVSAIESVDLYAPLVFLSREKKNTRTSEDIPEVSLCSGKAWQGLGNMGAILFRKSSALWSSFSFEYMTLLNEALRRNSTSRRWRDDIGIIIDHLWPTRNNYFQLLELGVLEKIAKAKLYGKNSNVILNDTHFLHMEGQRKIDRSYVRHVIARASAPGLAPFRSKIKTWAAKNGLI